MPQFVHVGASCIAGDRPSVCAPRAECRWVVRLVSGRSDFSVKRHCSFERNQRRMLPDVLCEPFVQCASLFFENPRSDCDSSSSQPFETFAAHRRIGIVHASDNTLNSRSNQRVGAWAGAAYVRAGFEVNVESCATRPFACLLESQNLGVLYSFISVRALACNCAATIHNDCAYTGIRRSQPNTFARKIQCATKKCFIGLSLASHELCIISPQGLTGTDRTRFIESVAGRSGKKPLQVWPQPPHYGPTGHREKGEAFWPKDRLGPYDVTASANILD